MTSSAVYSWFVRPLVAGLCCVTVLAACSRKENPPGVTDEMMAMTTLEGELHILARPGYVERGETDAEVDWVSAFEAETACKVTVTTFGSSEEMRALLPRGVPQISPPGDASWPPPGNAPFDVVIASGDVAVLLVREGSVFPIDVARVPSFTSIEPGLRDAAWHVVEGKNFGVPLQWAPNLLLYHADTFTQAPTSWSVVFEPAKLPDGRPNKGRVQAPAEPIYLADAALYLKAKRPALGIQDPYELDEAQYQAVLELARQQRSLVQRYWEDANVQVQDFRNEGVVASASWPFQANTLLANRVKVGTTIPEEGATAWADSAMLVTGARHPNCAYKWFEWTLSPTVQADIAAFNGTNPVVPKACESATSTETVGCKATGIDTLPKVSFWRTPEAACKSHPGGCVPYDRWASDYAKIRAGN